MQFLKKPPRFLFFTGKGGVDKTSGACTNEIAAFDEFTALLTDVALVARAQHATLREAASTHQELRDIGLKKQYLIINGVLPASEAAQDALAAAIAQREQTAINAILETLKALPQDQIALKSFNLVGLASLEQLLTGQDNTPLLEQDQIVEPLAIPKLSTLVDEIAVDEHGLVMLMGKGGVGKTTMAAAIAVELAHRGFPVHLTTSDPAAHLTETLDDALENLTVSCIDPLLEIERYRQHVLETKGSKLDAVGLALLTEDLRSPCTEEIAVFQTFSRIIHEAGKKFVVMDTAPTEHTLLLLDATGTYHREISRQMADKNLHFTTPIMQLQDPKQTKVILVSLAETTPVLEAADLQEDLRRADIHPWAWIINNSVAATETQSPPLTQRVTAECHEINKVIEEHSARFAVVPLFKEDLVGIKSLLTLSETKGNKL